MKSVGKLVFGAILGAGALAFSSLGASAAIVCSGDSCWHAHEIYHYPPEAHVIIHPDDWRWGEHEHYTWREHEGRGFWHGEEWHEF